MEKSSPSHSPDWAQLPPLVLDLISQKIKSILDYNRFRAVCTLWRFASHPRPHHLLPPQLPWLMIPYNPKPELGSEDRMDDGIRLFYDLWESKMRKLHLPETIGMMCSATYRGWLLLVAIGGAEVFLLNPITRVRIQLPPFTAPSKHMKDSHPDCWCASLNFHPSNANFPIIRVTFSTDLTDPDCLIMAFFKKSWMICYCRVGDPCWTKVDSPGPFEYVDATYYQGLFYLLCKGALLITDPRRHAHYVSYFHEELHDAYVYFLHGKSGVYIVAVHPTEEEVVEGECQEHDKDQAEKPTVKLKIELYQFQVQLFRLMQLILSIEENVDPMSLFEQITNTSDTIIFLGDNLYHLAVCSDDWELLEGGSMYLRNKHEPPYARGRHGPGSYSIYHYSKLDCVNFEPVVCDIAVEPPIFPPAPDMWFQPSYV